MFFDTMKDIIGRTITGSHLWGMEEKGSDIDYYVLYREPTYKILNGTSNSRNKHLFDTNTNGIVTDSQFYEIGHVVNLLIKGNINHIIGVCSTLQAFSTDEFKELAYITRTNLSKNIYHSINGLAKGNYEKFIKSSKENTLKKRNIITRTLQLGITLLERNTILFNATKDSTEDDILKLISKLEVAYNESKLSEKPDEKPFRDWLLKARLM